MEEDRVKIIYMYIFKKNPHKTSVCNSLQIKKIKLVSDGEKAGGTCCERRTLLSFIILLNNVHLISVFSHYDIGIVDEIFRKTLLGILVIH